MERGRLPDLPRPGPASPERVGPAPDPRAPPRPPAAPLSADGGRPAGARALAHRACARGPPPRPAPRPDRLSRRSALPRAATRSLRDRSRARGGGGSLEDSSAGRGVTRAREARGRRGAGGVASAPHARDRAPCGRPILRTQAGDFHLGPTCDLGPASPLPDPGSSQRLILPPLRTYDPEVR